MRSAFRFTTSRGGENSTGTMGIFAPALTKSADGRVATEAAWLNGDNLEKEEINEAEREKKRKDERKVLTLTGLLMEGVVELSSASLFGGAYLHRN